ncbi:putative MFS sugar transporter [Fonsecaea pedrosoi]|nr:putative MFS sugar transporter [Fonsecaea pedrosoi]
MALSAATLRLLIVIFVALGSTTYGYCASIISTTLAQPSFIAYFDLDTRSNATDLTGSIFGLFQTGGFFGTLSCLKSADWLGRRKALFYAGLVTTVGGGLQAGSVNIGMYIFARFLTGVGIGALVTLVPLYQSEIAPPKIRGFLVAMHGVMLCVGYSAASWVGLGFYFVDAGGAQWRLPLAIQALWPAVLSAGVLFLPESPRWLLDHDRYEEAFESFKRVRAESSDAFLSDEAALRADFAILREQIIFEKQQQLSLWDIFRLPHYRKRLIVGFVTMVAPQVTGTQIIYNYGSQLYKSLGFNTLEQLLLSCGWITFSPFGNWFNGLVVDRVGRVRMLRTQSHPLSPYESLEYRLIVTVIGIIGCVLCLVGEVITLAQLDKGENKAATNAAVFFLFLFVGFYASFIDATTYIYASEIWPTPIRAKGLALSISGLFLSSLAILQGAPAGFANIGWRYYLVFISVTSVMVVFMFFYFPETKKLSLEEIGEIFGDEVAHVDASTATAMGEKGVEELHIETTDVK